MPFVPAAMLREQLAGLERGKIVEGEKKTAVHGRIIRMEFERAPEGGDRGVERALLEQRQPQVVEQRETRRRLLERGLIDRDRGLGFAALEEEQAEIDRGLRVVRAELQRRAEGANRGLRMALRRLRGAEIELALPGNSAACGGRFRRPRPRARIPPSRAAALHSSPENSPARNRWRPPARSTLARRSASPRDGRASRARAGGRGRADASRATDDRVSPLPPAARPGDG